MRVDGVFNERTTRVPGKAKWQIWERGDDGKWTVASEGFDQRDARLEASRRNSALRRTGAIDAARFRAMPVGVVPYYDSKEK